VSQTENSGADDADVVFRIHRLSFFREDSRHGKFESAAAFQSDLVNMAQSRFHLSLAGDHSGITIIDRVLSQRTRFSSQLNKWSIAR
jgi:hypothetical protein